MTHQVINAYRFGSAGAGLSNKWRLNFSAKQSGAAFLQLQEAEMRATVGGADQCTGGTASASASASGAAANAFDDSTLTSWNTGVTTMPQWLEYDFATNVDVKQVTFTPQGAAGNPTAFTVEYHDGAAWQVYWTEDVYDSVSANQLIFSKPDSLAAGSLRWRLAMKSTQGGSSFVVLNAIEFRATSGAADLTAPNSTDGGNSINGTSAAFDDNSGTTWSSGFHPSSGTPAIAGYRFPTPKVVTEVAITVGSGANSTPTSFDVQYLDPATGTWVTSWSVAATGTWLGSDTKVFTKP
jgi:hypothetical protein